MLLDPISSFVDARMKEDPSPKTGNLKEEILKSTTCCLALSLRNLELRYFTCTPTLTYQRIDGVVFAGPYFIGVASGRQPSLMMRANNPLANAYERHFENIWTQHSRSVQVPNPRGISS
jgi:hypothetical protein